MNNLFFRNIDKRFLRGAFFRTSFIIDIGAKIFYIDAKKYVSGYFDIDYICCKNFVITKHPQSKTIYKTNL